MKKINHESNILKEAWHSIEYKDVLTELNASRDGLSSEEANKRLKFYGPNTLPEGKRITLFGIILHQLINPLIFILLAAAIVSIAIGEIGDAVFIFIVIFINSALGAYQEYNAEKSASSLHSLLRIKARVRRDGKIHEIASEDLVPGDIVYLESGLKVPADIRLLEEANLEIDESLLTGESVATKKQLEILRRDIGVAERSNMAFAGSTVMLGRGTGVVVGTGVLTQVGQIAQNVMEGESARPPLLIRMEKFVTQIMVLVIVLSVVIAVTLRFQGMSISTIFFFVVALAVSAIPEGLPVALTVALSIATKRMARRNVIVRKLTSVESLGSCTVIASDKTGTLTVNQQTAKKIILPGGRTFSINGEGYNGEGNVLSDETGGTVDFKQNEHIENLVRIAVLANEASLTMDNSTWNHHGDAMDVALLGVAYKLGLDPEEIRKAHPLTDKIPYESERKFSAAFGIENGAVYIGAKGAVETILDFCDTMVDGNSVKPVEKGTILKQAEEMAAGGYRVLAFAKGEFSNFEKKEVYEIDDIPSMVFHGLVCFIDPLRPEAKDSVAKCKKAGIKVIMITGDHPATAATIAQELGIMEKGQTAVTGTMLSESGCADSPACENLISKATVFARVSPIQKLEIVDVLIRDGEFVAVTGDGVNDAPALKRANIGVAMGSGTDVAKEVGSMIVLDDNFSSIVAGVEEGRFAYDNVRKVIFLLISTGAAQIIMVLLGIIAGLPLPFLPVQLLWINLVTNGIQDVALAFEGGEPGAMLKKPRKPSETIFNPQMIKQTLVVSITISIIVFGLWYWLNNYTELEETYARNQLLLLMVFMQNLHAFNSRSETASVFKIPIKRNYLLVFGVLAAQGIHILSMQIPFMQDVLHIAPITITEWLYILALAVPIMLVMEIFKFFTRSKKTDG